jgi:tRNA (guanine10-N2)-dimethyltransferase
MNDLIKTKSLNYLYLISSRLEYIELCAMEMKYIFGEISNENYHLSDTLVDINRSVFIKGIVTILYKHPSLDAIEQKMKDDELSYNNYKIHFMKFDDTSYQTRLNAMRLLGTTIEGDFAIKDPDIEFILTKINGDWIFGELQSNPNAWKQRRKKPHSYSHSLDITIAKTVINIAINNDFNTTIIDPCCGIGTVVIEGRYANVNIKGYEINPLVKHKCNLNLEHYGFIPDVIKQDMLESTEIFDVAILDLPYGHYSNISTEEQKALITKLQTISNKSLIITMEDMSKEIKGAGLKIIDSCEIKKSNTFKRYLTLCVNQNNKKTST